MITLLFALALGATAADDIAEILDEKLVFASTRNSPKRIHVSHCRKAHGGCRARLDAFADYFVAAANEHDLDPWLLAAMGIKESGLNPFAVGGGGEMGILQAHPKSKWGRSLKFLRSEKYREACRKEVGACQGELVMTLAGVLRGSIDKCGDLEKGLGMYNRGKCVADTGYARMVMRIHAKLLEMSEDRHEQEVDA